MPMMMLNSLVIIESTIHNGGAGNYCSNRSKILPRFVSMVTNIVILVPPMIRKAFMPYHMVANHPACRPETTIQLQVHTITPCLTASITNLRHYKASHCTPSLPVKSRVVANHVAGHTQWPILGKKNRSTTKVNLLK